MKNFYSHIFFEILEFTVCSVFAAIDLISKNNNLLVVRGVANEILELRLFS